ncbi:MAG TPA: c-type cytochrome [Steroidobacteraceae bacterium]|nr:c-type cytochrome [Steroidobacteraceae bacterium]
MSHGKSRALFGGSLLLCLCVLARSLLYAQQPPAGAQAGTQAAPQGGKTMTPVERADATPKGQLKNPYADSDAAVVESGKALYFGSGCNGCHGGNGGGGMCPPLTNDVWVYGGDDDTLFRLVAYGTQTLQEKGYTRKGMENVVGPMPPMGQVVKTDDDLWRILAFVRSNYHGAPECKFGCKGG